MSFSASVPKMKEREGKRSWKADSRSPKKIIFPSLAPNLPAPDAFPQLANLYNTLSKHPAFSEEDVCFAGDSSGANIALALIMYCLRSDTSHVPESAGTLLLVLSTVGLRHEH